MTLVLHIADAQAWAEAQANGVYRGDTLETEGFIHCSTAEQVVGVANAFFRGRSGLVLLCIDSARIEAEIRYENLEGGEELFPHIYGPLNVSAVVGVESFEPDADGLFTLPPRLQ